MDTGLAGKIALVPGSTSGIGLAVARSLAAEGARVVVVGRRGDLARTVAAGLPDAVGVEADLLDADDLERLVSTVTDDLGRVDVLVLNGGGPAPGRAEDMTPSAARDAVDRLLVPHVRLVEAFLPGMRERGWGRVVAVASSGVQEPIQALAASNVGRAALAGFLKSLAADVARDGVTVNMVLPGRIDTDRVASLDAGSADATGRSVADVRAASEASIPVGRYGRPDEFAAVVTFLASEIAGYVTGEQVRCDGGAVRHY
ncbi:MAG: SDR family oxidoreductase [Nocardioidaceae bacterium]|nr:SDR family oxidoreductase [Nocardioidaceae bacterium]